MASPLRRTCFDYRNNPLQYSKWQAYLRERQPPMLVVGGNNDPFFTVDGAKAYRREVPKAEAHLFEGGHFLLEEHAEPVATLIRKFLGAQ
jgi:pimeloyl-ACP methyl ester carboxylesterase